MAVRTLQTDGSRHDWLGDRGPRLTLVGYIDDATGRATGATFRDQEDSAGYLEALITTIRRYGVPGAVYHDRAGIFEPPLKSPLTLEEQLIDARVPTQLGRTFTELGIGSISAHSPHQWQATLLPSVALYMRPSTNLRWSLMFLTMC